MSNLKRTNQSKKKKKKVEVREGNLGQGSSQNQFNKIPGFQHGKKGRIQEARSQKFQTLVANSRMLVNKNFQAYLCQTTRFMKRSTRGFVTRLV